LEVEKQIMAHKAEVREIHMAVATREVLTVHRVPINMDLAEEPEREFHLALPGGTLVRCPSPHSREMNLEL
jgi:hypothetical protein